MSEYYGVYYLESEQIPEEIRIYAKKLKWDMKKIGEKVMEWYGDYILNTWDMEGDLQEAYAISALNYILERLGQSPISLDPDEFPKLTKIMNTIEMDSWQTQLEMNYYLCNDLIVFKEESTEEVTKRNLKEGIASLLLAYEYL